MEARAAVRVARREAATAAEMEATMASEMVAVAPAEERGANQDSPPWGSSFH